MGESNLPRVHQEHPVRLWAPWKGESWARPLLCAALVTVGVGVGGSERAELRQRVPYGRAGERPSPRCSGTEPSDCVFTRTVQRGSQVPFRDTLSI